jgi:hypothetical protein
LAPVIRLFSFRPTRPSFDSVLRNEAIPSLRGLPDLQAMYVGRQGPDELGPRLVASVWPSLESMDNAMGGAVDWAGFHPERLQDVVEEAVEVLSLAVSFKSAGAESARILRTLRGRILPGKRAAYIEEARAGVEADGEAGHGPLAYYLATGESEDTFVTLSAWSSWTAIEMATGGDIRRPLATRHPELIAAWEATHYEALEP